MKASLLFISCFFTLYSGISQDHLTAFQDPLIATVYFERIFENDTVSIWLESQLIAEDIILKEVAVHGTTHTYIKLSEYFGSYAIYDLNHLNPDTRRIESYESLVLMPYLFSQNKIRLSLQINSKKVNINIQVKDKHIFLTRIPYDILDDRTRSPEFKIEYSRNHPVYR